MKDWRNAVMAAGLAMLVGGAAWGQAPAEQAQEAPKKDEAKKDDKKWDVVSPPGEWGWKDVAIDVREGTWMNVDVSPKGDTVVFDLLGDIYTMALAGGEAKAISSGLAWDMQPRWSPDGTRIAFTSDRGGGDNIWTMAADGSDAKQITKESFRLLTSPVWTPDGQFIAARKHFTSRRSLGSGEIWLYHASGKAQDGLQLTTKPNDQKDVGEPAFSPDGKYLYYSWDATPGDSFQYDKDSNGEIYIISRLDRTTGETVGYITGAGGAVRPTPSPDGKSVAFVRRERFATCLFVQDVASGEVRKVLGDLTRDLQETWAVHGVYPSMAWTPDSKEVVYYAKGKLRRVDVGTGSTHEVPFHVADTRKVAEAVRFPVEVAPDEFDVKMLRWVEVAPKGDKVLFQALGHVWVRDLPEGKPRRLTKDEANFEFCPTFSRDGSQVAYTTWNEKEYGSARVVSSAGGEGKVVTNRPGIYVDPVFSPDGKTVVFGRVSGGYMLGNLYADDTGIFAAPAAGGEMARVTKGGTNPQFGADGERVFIVKSSPDKENDNLKLVSMKLDGVDEREHVKTGNGTEYRVSPDGKWLAWVERFKVYVSPLTPTGRTIDLGPKTNAQPVAKVSNEAGVNLNWSGDSASLHWSLGPTLYTAELGKAFAYLSGETPEVKEGESKEGEKKAEETIATSTEIGWKEATFKPTSTVVFDGARILTMRGEEVIENGVVVVEGNRIKAVGTSGEVAAPAGAKVVDCRGMVLMPGIVDVHAHGGQGQYGIVPERNWIAYANLAFGVTTIHDPSNSTEQIFAASELAKAGIALAPRTFSTGTILYGAAGSYKAEVDSLDDALFHLKRMKAVGAFSVKSYNQPRREQRQQVLEAARQTGMMVVPEGGALWTHNMTMVMDGHTGVEHTLPIDIIYGDVVALWSATKVGYTPTLGVCYGGLGGENYWYQHTNVYENDRLLTFVPRQVVDPRSRRRPMAPEGEYNHITTAGIAKALNDAGVTVHVGAHGQLAGMAAHWEMWMFTQGGMSNHQALKCATIEGAKYIGLDKDLGSVEAGKLADLIVFERDPLENIRNTQAVKYTMVNGRLLDSATMDELTPGMEKKCEPFFFTGVQGSLGIAGPVAECEGCGRVGCVGGVPAERAYR